MPSRFLWKGRKDMKYPYSVKHNGVWYAPNEEIPENGKTPVVKDEPKVEKPVEKVADESTEEKAEEPVEVPVEPTYTKTEINRMPIVDLRRLARKQGIKKAADKSGAELKAELIELLNL